MDQIVDPATFVDPAIFIPVAVEISGNAPDAETTTLQAKMLSVRAALASSMLSHPDA